MLERIAGADPALAATLHAEDGPKPLTCSDLFGGRSGAEGRTLQPGEACALLRVTGLTAVSGCSVPTACLLDVPPLTWSLADQDLRVGCVWPVTRRWMAGAGARPMRRWPWRNWRGWNAQNAR